MTCPLPLTAAAAAAAAAAEEAEVVPLFFDLPKNEPPSSLLLEPLFPNLSSPLILALAPVLALLLTGRQTCFV